MDNFLRANMAPCLGEREKATQKEGSQTQKPWATTYIFEGSRVQRFLESGLVEAERVVGVREQLIELALTAVYRPGLF